MYICWIPDYFPMASHYVYTLARYRIDHSTKMVFSSICIQYGQPVPVLTVDCSTGILLVSVAASNPYPYSGMGIPTLTLTLTLSLTQALRVKKNNH